MKIDHGITQVDEYRLLLPAGTYQISCNIGYAETNLQSGSFQTNFISGTPETYNPCLCHDLPTPIDSLLVLPLSTKEYRFTFEIECPEPREFGISTRWYTSSIRYGGQLVEGSYITITQGRATPPRPDSHSGKGMSYTYRFTAPYTGVHSVTWNTHELSSTFLNDRYLVANINGVPTYESPTINYPKDSLTWEIYANEGDEVIVYANPEYQAFNEREFIFTPFTDKKGRGSNWRNTVNRRKTTQRRK